MLTLGQLVLGTALVMTGMREVRRQQRGLRRIAAARPAHAWDIWGRRSTMIWGYALVGVALGFLVPPIGRASWVAAGMSRIALLPTPCETEFFNKGAKARFIRNLFMLLLGSACIAFGLGWNPLLF